MTSRSREHLLVPVALYAVSFALLYATARTLGVSLHEPPRLAATIDVAELFSPAGKLVFSWSRRLDALSTTHPGASAATFLGGYVWAITARAPHTLLDGLLALRLSSIAIAAATPPLVFVLSKRWLGLPLSVLAASLALLSPRALADAATLGDGVAVAIAFAALALHLQSLERRSVPAGLAAAALIGLGAAISTSTLVVVPVMLVHFAIERRDVTARLVSRGGLAIPVGLAAAPFAGGSVFLLANPTLVSHATDQLRAAAIAALSPRGGPGAWGGSPPSLDALPRSHALTSTLLALPTTTTVLAVLAAIALWNLPTRELSDGGSRARLFALTLAMVVVFPFVAPSWFLSFPSHWALAVPCVAPFAAYGAGVLARAVPWANARAVVLTVCAAAAFGSSLPSPTLAAFVPGIAGGVMRAAHGIKAPLHDATPLGGLAAPIDALHLAAPTVYAPDIPADVWTWMIRLGRLETNVVPVSREDAATLLVLSGDVRGHGGTVVAEVRRDGQPVLTLLRK